MRKSGPVGASAILLAAHSETVGAGAKMPVRKQMQVSTKAVIWAGYYCSTPLLRSRARGDRFDQEE
jgi:hypothetical protein